MSVKAIMSHGFLITIEPCAILLWRFPLGENPYTSPANRVAADARRLMSAAFAPGSENAGKLIHRISEKALYA